MPRKSSSTRVVQVRRLRFNIADASGRRKFDAGSLVEVLSEPDAQGRVSIRHRGVRASVLRVDLEPVAEVLP